MTYDINIWATVDGVDTAMLPVYIDTPYTVSQTSPIPQGGGCPAIGYAQRYVTYITNTIVDMLGVSLTKIDLNETLENQKLLQNPSNWGFPVATPWPVSVWSTNTTFIDQLSACGPATGGMPQQVNYNTSATTGILNETQKLWIGSQTHYSGECVQVDILQLNTGFPTQTNIINPGSSRSAQINVCSQGNTILN